jgi:hypothetical protein
MFCPYLLISSVTGGCAPRAFSCKLSAILLIYSRATDLSKKEKMLISNHSELVGGVYPGFT